MKRKGNKSDFTDERNAELRAAFFSQGAYSTSDESLRQTLRTPTSRFWVDPDRARDIMSRIERDPKSIETMLPERQRMYMALYRKYREIRRLHPAKSKVESVTMAIYSGAPEFYLSPSRARHIIYNSL